MDIIYVALGPREFGGDVVLCIFFQLLYTLQGGYVTLAQVHIPTPMRNSMIISLRPLGHY